VTYRGRNLEEIAFPLGGIGTGCVSLGGWGQLRDWEVMNRPAKGNTIPQVFFTLRMQVGRKPPVLRVLQGPAGGPLAESGHSAPRATGEGLPHFRAVSFTGHFPFAEVALSDPTVPVRVRLEAFSPFIPLADRDSSIPVAILLYHLTNTRRETVAVTFVGNLTNVIGDRSEAGRVNQARSGRGLTGLYLTAKRLPADSPRFGSLALSTWAAQAKVWPRWRANELWKFWERVEADDLPPRGRGTSDTGSLIIRLRLRARETATVPIFITWHFPTFEKYWGRGQSGGPAPTWRNYYASQWRDAWDVALHVRKHFPRLYRETRLFHDGLWGTTAPDYVLDAVSSQLAILRSPTVLRLADGTFYGFEGCNNTAGCCEGSCTHVWNYAQALAYLFPALQRSMLEASLHHALEKDGHVHFRLPLPLGTKPGKRFFPCADGQMGQVMQAYREWLISADDGWLRRMWPLAKRALEFAWKYWDRDRDGVMEGMQHNTYDIEFYGPNTLCGSLYLGALRAAEEMARALGDEASARGYRELFARGSHWTDAHLWNGDYYEQKVNPRAHESWPRDLRRMAEARGRDDRFRTWPRWQFGAGCLSDQLLGQWLAGTLGLGYVYDRRHVRKALQSIFRCNWRPHLWEHPTTQRVYATDGEAGLLLATWPRGGRPGYPFLYFDEVWCGVEYQVASHLIAEGFVEDGLAVVKGLRDRYRGSSASFDPLAPAAEVSPRSRYAFPSRPGPQAGAGPSADGHPVGTPPGGSRRNPWDEIECGHHYARSLASYALLGALAGFHYHGPRARLTLRPVVARGEYRTFFSVGSGWGRASLRREARRVTLRLQVDLGQLTLRELVFPMGRGREVKVTVAGRKCGAARAGRGPTERLCLAEPVTVSARETLTATVI
jgi:uncharacterized protein (DUF608 family)